MRNTSFSQDCPTCGRKLFVRRAYLERQVLCPHCRAEFLALDTADPNDSPDVLPPPLLQRADELLLRVNGLGYIVDAPAPCLRTDHLMVTR